MGTLNCELMLQFGLPLCVCAAVSSPYGANRPPVGKARRPQVGPGRRRGSFRLGPPGQSFEFVGLFGLGLLGELARLNWAFGEGSPASLGKPTKQLNWQRIATRSAASSGFGFVNGLTGS
jgi:hypothetical protein